VSPTKATGAKTKLWTVVGLLLLLAVFALQNTQVVEVRLLFWKVGMSRSILVLGVLTLGGLAGFLLGTLRGRGT
jgi:uncharacterized integral membrane protein